MPRLTNELHERFCQLLPVVRKRGGSNSDAYREAGGTGTKRAAEVSASRILHRPDVQARLAELAAPAVRKAQVSMDSLIQQLDSVFDGAAADKQWNAAGSAAAMKAKLTGYLRERLEIGGPGDFDACQTPAEIFAKIRHESDDALRDWLEALEAITEAITGELAFRAINVPSASPASHSPYVDEAAASLAAIGYNQRRRR